VCVCVRVCVCARVSQMIDAQIEYTFVAYLVYRLVRDIIVGLRRVVDQKDQCQLTNYID